ncbi:SfmA family fimbriae-like adhesin [Buttiauxella brennerae ATCC 51605]|jgi:major type 1 subunit fimbrin (pilin)|uniref:SfmA family fimbriae-like adhesin n=1 Tax=Buttiauxella brennerae ATCC 51605 TaxID=1354251 RepID=A0A1B7IQ27_9ENTR|nr:fimbrial protein [Buttiauxella brennerae]OAT31842.1 SfmA family fimbriae-like adhesin [Buttiauxella brennerae ATCC 51605]
MKRNLIAMAIAATSILSAASVFAEDGTVNFTGEIIPNPCVVDIGANDTMTVDLGKVGITSFKGVGSRATATKFILRLKDCPIQMVTARFKFDGAAYNGDDSVLKLSEGSQVATGVAIELSDIAAKLPLYTASTSYTLVPGVNELPFYARYIQMASDVTAGPANSVATFTVNYN